MLGGGHMYNYDYDREAKFDAPDPQINILQHSQIYWDSLLCQSTEPDFL